MNTKEIIDIEDKYFINTFTRQPIVLDHGDGVKVYDKDGNEIAIQDVLKSPKPDFVEDINMKDHIVLLKRYMKILMLRSW